MIQIQRFVCLFFLGLCACQTEGPGPHFVALEKSKLMEGETKVKQKVFPPLSPKRTFQYSRVDVYTLDEWFKTKHVLIVYFHPEGGFRVMEHKQAGPRLVHIPDYKRLDQKIKKSDYTVFCSVKERQEEMVQLVEKAEKVGFNRVFVLSGGARSWQKIKDMASL